MKLCDRLILKEMGLHTVFVSFALLGLFAFFDFLNLLTELGRTGYSFKQISLYVFLGLPGHLYELLPISGLISTLLALGRLVQNSELTILKAAGFSNKRFFVILMFFGSLISVGDFCLGEYVSPQFESWGQALRLHSTGSSVGQRLKSGLWTREGQIFLNAKKLSAAGELSAVSLFIFDEKKTLKTYIEAKRAYWKEGKWIFEHVEHTQFLDQGHLLHTIQPIWTWSSTLTPQLLSVLLLSPEQSSFKQLNQYIHYLEKSHLDASSYRVALWNKVAQPFSVFIMILLALPFVQIGQRHQKMGARLFTGIMIGLSLFFLNRFFAHAGTVYGWHPIWSSFAPPIFCLMFIYAIKHWKGYSS